MAGSAGRPPLSVFTAPERRVIRTYRTPVQVQRYLNGLPYNTEPAPGGATLRSFRGVVREGTAHCMEAALAAAVILEQHGYRPLVLSFESIDELDHVLFVYRRDGRWGSIGRSRDPGLHGRRPVFRSARDLALSYVEPYIDYHGRITGYTVVDLRDVLGDYDWRLSENNVWKAERVLLEAPHRPIRSSDTRIDRLRRKYVAFRKQHGRKPLYYRHRHQWSELPTGNW
jgi:hypothetical protein